MARTQRQGKRASNSRKQARAVRSAPTPAVAEAPVATGNGTAAVSRTTKPYRAGRKVTAAGPAAVVHTLPREQEYAFIREDLVRLLITSGILTVVMIALLFVVDR